MRVACSGGPLDALPRPRQEAGRRSRQLTGRCRQEDRREGWVEVAVVRQTLRRLRDSRGAKSRARDDGQARLRKGRVTQRQGAWG